MDENLLHELVGAALKAGADAAEAVWAERQSLSVSVRLGDLEDVEREEARDLGVRVFIGRKQASVSGSDVSASRSRQARRSGAQHGAPGAGRPLCGACAARPPSQRRRFPTCTSSMPPSPTPEDLEARALAAEDAARAVEGVTNSDCDSGPGRTARWRLVTSSGFSGEHRASSFYARRQRHRRRRRRHGEAGEGRYTRWLADLPTPGEIGAEAGRRAVARLGARKIASTPRR